MKPSMKMTSDRQTVRLRKLQGKEFMSLKSCSCIALEKSSVIYLQRDIQFDDP